MPMPAPQDTRLNLADNPWFLQDMHSWRDERPLDAGDKKKKTKAPDPSLLGREDSDMFKLIMQMMGAEGYLEYMNELRNRREAGPPAPAPSPTPPPTPTPGSDIDIGIGAINERKRKPSDYGI